MKTIRLIGRERVRSLFLPFVFLSVVVIFTTCKDESEPGGDAYFEIEGSPTELKMNADETISQDYLIRSNRPWKIELQEENNWVRPSPDKGEDDGIFRFSMHVNSTLESRTANFAFIVDGVKQPGLFRVEQAGTIPYIVFNVESEGILIPPTGGEVTIDVDANVEWTYSLDDDSWVTSHSSTQNQIIITAPENLDKERSLTVTATSSLYPEAIAKIVITQRQNRAILDEDFNWLNYGSAIPYETSGETRYDNWTPEERARGWTSTHNEFSNDIPLYARQGFVKLGKTNYGGDLISPKLEEIEGTKDVKVTFKAVAYVSAGGAIDSNELKIILIGPGSPSTDVIIVDNIPNNRAEDNAGIINNVWDPERAFSFTITGATSETQIKFLGKAYDLREEAINKNRIFLDDIKVELID